MELYDRKPLSRITGDYPSVSLIVMGCKVAQILYSISAVTIVAGEEE